MGIASEIRDLSEELGFSAVRFAPLPPPALDLRRYRRWLAAGHHAHMEWMVRHLPLKTDPGRLLPGARTAAVLAMDYAHPRPPHPGGIRGSVSRYAWGRDYHRVVGGRLRRLRRALAARHPEGGLFTSVDSGPVFERSLAVRAGLGFSGKNTCVIAPGQGSWRFLAVVLLDVDLPSDTPIEGGCGTCRRCLDACPTGALVEPGVLDARRCLSWLTIEHRGDIPLPLRIPMGGNLFGCDRCQEVCPHNHRPPPCREPDFAPRPGLAWPDPVAILRTDEATLQQRLAGTPLRRAGARLLQRNACVVLGNLGTPHTVSVLEETLRRSDPLLRRHAAWALARLECMDAVGDAAARERDPTTAGALRQMLRSPPPPLISHGTPEPTP